MANFQQALAKTLIHEGGYQNNPDDSGNWFNGINYGTKYGITAADVVHYFPAFISDLNCVRNLTVDQAGVIYAAGYWKDLYSQINDQPIAEKLFDMGVLMGVKTAVKLLQITLQSQIAIVPDGVFGPETLSDVNQAAPADLLSRYRSTLVDHCISIMNHNPKDTQFVRGWITRISS